MSHPPLITDIGKPVMGVEAESGVPLYIHRYAVWTWKGDRYEVAITSDDLAALAREYHVPAEAIKIGVVETERRPRHGFTPRSH